MAPLAKKFISEVEEVLIQSFKKENIVRELSKSIAESLFIQFQEEFTVIKDDIHNIRKEFEEFKKVCEEVEIKKDKKLNNLDQKNRDNNVVVLGLKERQGQNENCRKEIIDFINDKLDIKLTENDIARCHRFGKLNQNKPRPVLIQFSNHNNKLNIYNAKKNLKGCGVVFKEDLTKLNLEIYREASDKYGNKNTWTKNGITWVKTATRVITYNHQLNDEPLDTN